MLLRMARRALVQRITDMERVTMTASDESRQCSLPRVVILERIMFFGTNEYHLSRTIAKHDVGVPSARSRDVGGTLEFR